jgi:hypothetical protein
MDTDIENDTRGWIMCVTSGIGELMSPGFRGLTLKGRQLVSWERALFVSIY